MNKRIALLLVVAITLSMVLGIGTIGGSTVTAATTYQKVNFSQAIVTASVLNIREGISTDKKIVCKVKKGDKVVVFGKIADWYAVYIPSNQSVGVAAAKYLQMAGATTAPTKTPAPAPAPTKTPAPAPAPTPAPTKTPQAGTPTTPAPSVPQISVPDSTDDKPAGVSQEEQDLLDYVNKARKTAGLAPLAFDMDLMKVARIKAKDMVDKNYFDHTSPTYGSPFEMMKQFNISYKAAGENIAGNKTVKGAFDAWMNSPGHKKNILSAKFNMCGFGIVPSSRYGKMLVQMFIQR